MKGAAGVGLVAGGVTPGVGGGVGAGVGVTVGVGVGVGGGVIVGDGVGVNPGVIVGVGVGTISARSVVLNSSNFGPVEAVAIPHQMPAFPGPAIGVPSKYTILGAPPFHFNETMLLLKVSSKKAVPPATSLSAADNTYVPTGMGNPAVTL